MTHVKTWDIRLDLTEPDTGGSQARVTLDTGTNTLHGEGRAEAAEGRGVEEIQDELAVGRALLDLGNQLGAIGAADSAG